MSRETVSTSESQVLVVEVGPAIIVVKRDIWYVSLASGEYTNDSLVNVPKPQSQVPSEVNAIIVASADTLSVILHSAYGDQD